MIAGSPELLILGAITAYVLLAFWRQIVGLVVFAVLALIITGLLAVLATLHP